jgi:hypothetical protein
VDKGDGIKPVAFLESEIYYTGSMCWVTLYNTVIMRGEGTCVCEPGWRRSQTSPFTDVSARLSFRELESKGAT